MCTVLFDGRRQVGAAQSRIGATETQAQLFTKEP